MIHTLVVTLGRLGESLIDATEQIIGRSDQVAHLTVDWDADLETLQADLAARITAINQGSGVLLLTDIFGSTATNICLTHAKVGEVEVVTGVNLPMIIKASTLSEGATLAEAANILRNQGAKAISYRWLYDRKDA